MFKRACLSVVVICLLAYSLAISSIPKDNNQIPTLVDQIITNIDMWIRWGDFEKTINMSTNVDPSYGFFRIFFIHPLYLKGE